MANTKQPKKKMEKDPVCESIERDKNRPLSAYEREQAAKKTAKKK